MSCDPEGKYGPPHPHGRPRRSTLNRKNGITNRPAGAHGGKRAKLRLGEFNTKVLRGEIQAHQFTDDDLARLLATGFYPGQHGGGTPNAVIPLAIVQEFKRRMTSQAVALIQANVTTAAAYIGAVIHGTQDPEPERLKAAIWNVERVLGKAPQHTTLTLDAADLKPEEAMLYRAAAALLTARSNTQPIEGTAHD
jgi:hypothetical protein